MYVADVRPYMFRLVGEFADAIHVRLLVRTRRPERGRASALPMAAAIPGDVLEALAIVLATNWEAAGCRAAAGQS